MNGTRHHLTHRRTGFVATATGIIACCIVILGCRSGFSRTDCDEGDRDRTPVVLVHGYRVPPAHWQSLIGMLTADGYPRRFVLPVSLQPNSGPNRSAAEQQIAPAVEKLLGDVNTWLRSCGYSGQPKERVDMISHSMGSVSSRWYAGHVRPERIRVWISLAGANHGTDDLCPSIGKNYDFGGADDLCPAYRSSPPESIQMLLNGLPRKPDVDETPYGLGRDLPGVASVAATRARRIVYWTVRTSRNDRWISPDDSVILDGAGGLPVSLPAELPVLETPPGNFRMTNAVGHGMITDAAVGKLIVLLLKTADEKMPRS